MYVAILSSALDDWVTDLSGSDLVDYALVCRDELRAVSAPTRVPAYTALAAEIAYDRALIALCTERGIDAHATSFIYPRDERHRIERVLRSVGVDLDAPLVPRDRTQTPSGPQPEASDAANAGSPEGSQSESTIVSDKTDDALRAKGADDRQ